METDETKANAGADENLTDEPKGDEGTSESTQDKSKADPVVQGLNRKINQQNAAIKKLTDDLTAAQKVKDADNAETVKAELEAAKSELARAKVLAKYAKHSDKLEAVMQRGVDPSLIDDDFVKMFDSNEEPEETVTAHNPPRGTPNEVQKATQVLKSLDSLF